MSTVDWVLLACVLASMLLGAWRGLVYEVLSLLGWLVAFVVARIWAADVALWLPMQDWDMQLRYAAGFVLLFVLALFGWGLVSWLHAAAPGTVVAGFSPGAVAGAGAGCGFAAAAAGMGTLSAGCMTRRCSAGVGWQKQFG